jgi:predicted NBD/HSP70 family sugar kinase
MRKIDLNNSERAGKHTIKEINQKLILNLIRERQPISRAEIAKKTKLQRSTVTIITTRLQQKNWIYEGENGHYSGGRRPTNLYLNEKRSNALGVAVSKEDTTLALADLNGKLLCREHIKTKTDDPKFFSRLAEKIVNFSTHSSHQVAGGVAGIGVGLPGYIEKSSGKIIAAENFGWFNVNAGEQLRKQLKKPVYFENNAKLAALAELWFGEGRMGGSRNLIYITTHDGLGTGLILNGEVFNGARDGAAEFGHFSLFPDGPQCVCGNYGCWELYASDRATIHRYIQAFDNSQLPFRKPEKISIHDVIDHARQGEEAARKALDSTARYLGLGITNLILGLNPEMVIIGDELATAWDLMEETILKTVQSRVPSYYLEGLKIKASTIKESPTLFGAIALVLANVFSISKQP